MIKDKSKKINTVVLCGGSGSRLWPMSRKGYPKQFIKLDSNRSFFQNTMLRANKFSSKNTNIELMDTLIVSNEEHRFIIEEQLSEIEKISYQLFLEPHSKNTAPALTIAALKAFADNEDSILIVCPADHVISDESIFTETINKSIEYAENGSIVVLGIKPDKPETGYGYIEFDNKDVDENNNVVSFIEKPNLSTAKAFLRKKNYLWNSGIFIVKSKVWLDAFKFFHPENLALIENALKVASKELSTIKPDSIIFEKVKPNSIDYAVIEKCDNTNFNLKVMQLNAGWSDIGSWDSLWEKGKKDINENVINGTVYSINTENSYITSSERLIATVGVDNMIVVETNDALLIANKDQSQDVKSIVSMLEADNRSEHKLQRKVYRPWGWFDTIQVGIGYKVKHIFVKPNSSLSLQKHKFRAEHWVIVKGHAEVTCDNKVSILKENQSTYIPQGAIHRLANKSEDFLEIIEIQSGSYLGEDDIQRIEDDYGR